jgi:predicted RNA polymerase sigma factor
VAVLICQFGDIDTAEAAVQDAFALRHGRQGLAGCGIPA